jgi:RNA polymerase-binding transcription factor DksA
MATAKKAPAKKVVAPAKSSAPSKTAAPAKKAPSPAKQTPARKAPVNKAAAAKAPAKKAASKRAPVKKAASEKAPAKKAAAVKAAPSAKHAPVAKAAAAVATPAKKALAAKKAAPVSTSIEIPPPKGFTKDGIAYTKDFDAKFVTVQKALLIDEKAALLGQATRLEDEANSLIEEQEMGDVQFDDEGGEGDTMVVERSRDLALSAQARQTMADIDAALARLLTGHYGYSTVSGRPIPRERLEAIPWATMLVEEKVGGIGRR